MRRRSIVIVVAVVAVLVVVGAGVTWWLVTRPAGPDAAAAAYVRALSDKDAAAAVRLLDDSVPTTGLEKAFSGASAFPTGTTVEHVEEHGATATARVRFRLDGASHAATLSLTHHDDGGWRLAADALGAVTASISIGDTVSVGGQVAPAAKAQPLLPAVYPVAAAPVGILTGGAPAVVLPGATVEVAVKAVLSPDAAKAARAQLDAYEDRCATAATAVPAHCGLRVPWAADLATLDALAFRIDKRPSLTLSADATTFAATGGTIVATATGTTRAGATGSFTYRAQDWALRGEVSFAGGRMTLSVE